MLKTPRILHIFRQATTSLPQHESILQQSLRRTTLPTTPLRRSLATSQRTRPSPPRLRSSPVRQQARRNNGTKTSPKAETETEAETSRSLTQLTMSERMKAMSKKYGWVVVGIYLGLSALDFPFCFLAVRLFGTERIAAIEHAIMSRFWAAVEKVVPSLGETEKKMEEVVEEAATREGGQGGIAEVVKRVGARGEDASIWTQLLLAYGVHKSLIFIRIPITLAITPRVVKTLRKWGWSIGKAK